MIEDRMFQLVVPEEIKEVGILLDISKDHGNDRFVISMCSVNYEELPTITYDSKQTFCKLSGEELIKLPQVIADYYQCIVVYDNPFYTGVPYFTIYYPNPKIMKKEKLLLMLDMDGVIADFVKGFQKICPDLPLGDGPDYEERSKKVNEVCLQNPMIFHELELLEENTFDVVKEMMELFDVYFLSTPMDGLPESYAGKRIWLQRHFGELSYKKLILTHRKDLVAGDFLVDDTKRNGADGFKGEHIHFGTDERFKTLKSVLDYLKTKI